MNLPRFHKVWITAACAIFSLFFAISPIFAQSTQQTAAMTLNPQNPTINPGQTVNVVVSLSSSTPKQASYAKAVLQFDPEILEITDVVAGSIFCTYPTDSASYASDNTQGVIMVTGFSDGTTDCAYPQLTATQATFFTVQFRGRKAGASDLQFRYSGTNDVQNSAIMDNNSPTQFILTTPTNGEITVSSGVTPTTPIPQPPDDLGVSPLMLLITAGGGMILAIGIYAFIHRPRSFQSRVLVRD